MNHYGIWVNFFCSFFLQFKGLLWQSLRYSNFFAFLSFFHCSSILLRSSLCCSSDFLAASSLLIHSSLILSSFSLCRSLLLSSASLISPLLFFSTHFFPTHVNQATYVSVRVVRYIPLRDS